jgi:hypothetical protein
LPERHTHDARHYGKAWHACWITGWCHPHQYQCIAGAVNNVLRENSCMLSTLLAGQWGLANIYRLSPGKNAAVWACRQDTRSAVVTSARACRCSAGNYRSGGCSRGREDGCCHRDSSVCRAPARGHCVAGCLRSCIRCPVFRKLYRDGHKGHPGNSRVSSLYSSGRGVSLPANQGNPVSLRRCRCLPGC